MLVKKPDVRPLSSITKSVASKDRTESGSSANSARSRKIGFKTAGNMKNNKNNQPTQNIQTAEESLLALYRRARDLTQQIEQESVVDNEKVNAIKAAINAGTYLVDADRIADKLIEMEVELTKPSKDA